MALLRKILIALFLGIALMAALAASGVSLNLISSEFSKERLTEIFGPNYFWKLVAIAAASTLTAIFLTHFFEKRLSKSTKTTAPPPALLNHEDLKKKYEDRRDQKLGGRLPINLRRFDFSDTAALLSNKKFREVAPEKIEGEITELFHETNGRLLVVGRPGAGKTTLLLDLAIGLCDGETWPVLVNLATWNSDFGTIETWLKKVLPVELGISASPKTIEKLLADPRTVLLFDGLDEIAEAPQRAACLAAIDLFGADGRRRYAISSRKQEFLDTKRDAHVQLPIEVGPLDFEQIRRELERRGQSQPEDLALLAALEADPLLREAAETPFYFNCLQLLFAENQRPAELGFVAGDRSGREREVLGAFVGNQLGKCSKHETRAWLGFLADRMERRGLVKFELTDLQFDFSKWGLTSLFCSNFVLFLVLWFSAIPIWLAVIAPFFILTSILPDSLAVQIIWAVGLSTLALVPILGVYCSIRQETPSIKIILPAVTKKNFTPSIQVFLQMLGIAYIVFVRANVKFDIFTALTFAYFSLILMLFSNGIMASRKLINDRVFLTGTPYGAFISSAQVLYFSILQHCLLRYQLSKKGLLPLRLVDFLNEMSAQKPKTRRFTTAAVHLMESDGASWRFRHRLIQEWFAARWEEPTA